MKCKILHESAGRLRVHLCAPRMSCRQADVLEAWLSATEGVVSVKVYERTGDAAVRYVGARARVIDAFASFSYDRAAQLVAVPEHTARAMNHAYEEKLVMRLVLRGMKQLLLPAAVRGALAWLHALRFLRAGLASLRRGRLEVPVLDATAVTVSLLRGDRRTASSVMFLLRLGELLEEWTHKRSVDDLAGAMSLGVERVWLRRADGTEVLAEVSAVQPGDCVVVRAGNLIPLDGKVVEGEAEVNQASMTGEALAVRKAPGSYVYAGTAVEAGNCVIAVDKVSGEGRYDRIVRAIEASERLKSAVESRSEHLADRLVPWSFGATVLTYLITRNATKAISILMVDFSCALKLSMPLSVLSAMREALSHGISVKGGRFLEAVAAADTVVFDKTGTLTRAEPRVVAVVPFGGQDEAEMLRLAACLEEHFPHTIANAVVRAARERGLDHEERHSRVDYVVAHGIASEIDGAHAVIGSRHFIFEDEGCRIPAGEEARFDALPAEYSMLYLALSGELAAVILIEDPVRSEAADAIARLRTLGLSHIVMMTGDSRRTAAAVARTLGIDEFRAEVLPEDKARFVREARAAGHTVIMVGDGINDSPALSEADVGVAISTGAAIAREIADVTVSEDDLRAFVTLRRLSEALMRRIRGNYRSIVSFNLALIVLGVLGVLPPATSALLHNGSTIAIGLRSMTRLLEEDTQR
ncbi:MAG: heavy metal translocating P-type ATPase [Oscillospiraceae bacterium]|nr:heavy metal translocating P-type ATPase [Oscillospiraceae bacterium]